MTGEKKKFLTKEADAQLRAIRTIGHWKNIALGLSAVGAAVTYLGFVNQTQSLLMRITGIILLILGFLGAAVLNLGIKNGKNNVNKILQVIESEGYGK